jgi:hypothetical protein
VIDIAPTGHHGTVHRSISERYPVSWVKCSCGYVTPRYSSESDARDAMDSHLYFSGQTSNDAADSVQSAKKESS